MKSLKDAFLNKYNPKRTISKALSSAISASVQHNSLYRVDVELALKKRVQQEWKSYLEGLVDRYKKPVSVTDYEHDIETLKVIMNDKYSAAFRSEPHPKFKTDPGFRISHAQKSISIFLKHLWCMGDIACPPQCPVDRIILQAAGRPSAEIKWGYVNSIEEHRLKISFLEAAKGGPSDPLAEWELEKFKVLQPSMVIIENWPILFLNRDPENYVGIKESPTGRNIGYINKKTGEICVYHKLKRKLENCNANVEIANGSMSCDGPKTSHAGNIEMAQDKETVDDAIELLSQFFNLRKV